jgi:hypothetical protein
VSLKIPTQNIAEIRHVAVSDASEAVRRNKTASWSIIMIDLQRTGAIYYLYHAGAMRRRFYIYGDHKYRLLSPSIKDVMRIMKKQNETICQQLATQQSRSPPRIKRFN